MAGTLTEQQGTAERAPARFATLSIAANEARGALLQETATAAQNLMVLRNTAGYPHMRELKVAMNHSTPEVVLLDLADQEQAAECAECVREHYPLTPIIGVGARGPITGFPYLVPFPPAPDDLARMVHQGIHALRGQREDNLLAFLPAKAGCGASTVALHTAGALAALGKRVLLIDADFHSGALGVMVETSTGYSLQQALRGIAELDRFRLEEAVCEAFGMDLLLSDGTPVRPLPSWEDYFRLLDLARTRYDAVVVDLPEVINPATREFVQRARAVYVVTTQELVPLKLASRRFKELAACGAPADSPRLVVNRWQKSEIDAAAVQTLVRRPVEHEFPNDYRAVRKALNDGCLIQSDSGLGRSFRDFAKRALGGEEKKTGFGASLGGLLRFGRGSDSGKANS